MNEDDDDDDDDGAEYDGSSGVYKEATRMLR
jgi:hypothetical protein